MTAAVPAWLAAIPVRRLLEEGVEARFPLPPGDRPLVEAGQEVAAGDPLLEHLRDRRIDEVDVVRAAGAPAPLPGDRWTTAPGRRRGEDAVEGELLGPVPGRRDRWRLVTGEHRDVVEAPVAGVVTEVRPGAEIRLRSAWPALRAGIAAGSTTHGRLELATDPLGELKPGGIDVGRAGAILVVGSRIDAEALTRARAMGVRGIISASLAGKDLRDFQASEKRQRAALHAAPSFGVLALDGALRHPITPTLMALFTRLEGCPSAILSDPAALAVDTGALADAVLALPPDLVRIRTGVNAGLEGRVVGLAGPRRFAGGVILEAAWIRIGDEEPLDVPLGDLERYA